MPPSGGVKGSLRARRQASRRRIEESSGFPRPLLFLFLLLAIGLGLLISWSLGLSVKVEGTGTSQGLISSSEQAAVNDSGVTVLSEHSLGPEVQLLIDTGTLQVPATFDVAACLAALGVREPALVLEEVSWERDGASWLVVHSHSTITEIRETGGEVSASIVRSTCGTNSQSHEEDLLFSGTVLVAPLS